MACTCPESMMVLSTRNTSKSVGECGCGVPRLSTAPAKWPFHTRPAAYCACNAGEEFVCNCCNKDPKGKNADQDSIATPIPWGSTLKWGPAARGRGGGGVCSCSPGWWGMHAEDLASCTMCISPSMHAAASDWETSQGACQQSPSTVSSPRRILRFGRLHAVHAVE